ncbi:MAG: hypothetical protein RBU37_19215, partial [Myxococcota bacterium]|nr:hypothetical protein [Myxococcota bacterium]
AYFQWVEGGEHRVARFRFDWKHQKLEPRGLLAIDLMAEGEDRASETPVDIWPVTYERNLSIPRSERWKGQSKDTCKQAAAKPYCDAFAMVLEQEDFIVAVQWLLTSDKTAVQEFRACVDRKDCKWSTKPDESNPDPEKPELFNIEYEYIIHGEKKKIGFKVNPNKNDITPSDEISRWAFWSVTPRT